MESRIEDAGLRCGNCSEYTPFPDYIIEHRDVKFVMQCAHCHKKHVLYKDTVRMEATHSRYDDDDYWLNQSI